MDRDALAELSRERLIELVAWHWVFQTPEASYHVIVPVGMPT